jgi:hypothetical protein
MTAKPKKQIVRIGGAAGALVDSAIAVPQLLTVPEMNYLALDYLGEGAMGLMRRLREMDPRSGFLPDFVDVHVGPFLAELKSRGVKVISNAGGMNPEGLAAMIRARAKEMNIDIKVGVVTGDEIDGLVPEIRKEGVVDMFTGEPFPDKKIGSINAYLGAFGIAAALDAGADMVVTGRVVDSALILGPLIHEFGWGPDDHDLLSAGTAAGHLLECGAQVSGGTFTDWEDVPDWANSGFPYGECFADGTVIITKPEGTGGLVSVGTVAEQLMYEISDPQAYIVPDVVCDWSEVKLEQVGPNRVKVSGAKGYPATSQYKVCVTYDDGWRSTALIPIVGMNAVGKAKKTADALLERTSKMLRDRNQPDWRMKYVEIIGTETMYGPRAQKLEPREVLLKVVVDHEDMGSAMMFWREQGSAIMNMAVGTTIPPVLGTPRAFPITEMHLFLIDRDRVTTQVAVEGKEIPFKEKGRRDFSPSMIKRPPAQPKAAGDVEVPLVKLAFVRSGEKGELFNVGVIARKPEYLPFIRASLTANAVSEHYRHLVEDGSDGKVEIFEMPGIHAINYIVYDAQGGGINVSPRFDAAAKGMGQLLLEIPIKVSAAIAQQLN